MPCGCDVGSSMGVNTWAAFAGTPDDALVVGDFAVLEGELQTVLKTLRGADINIVAIHQHMTGENPRMIFLHYYGRQMGPGSMLVGVVLKAQGRRPMMLGIRWHACCSLLRLLRSRVRLETIVPQQV
jgi:hypothetical protein